jgi:hypothetical protein
MNGRRWVALFRVLGRYTVEGLALMGHAYTGALVQGAWLPGEAAPAGAVPGGAVPGGAVPGGAVPGRGVVPPGGGTLPTEHFTADMPPPVGSAGVFGWLAPDHDGVRVAQRPSYDIGETG